MTEKQIENKIKSWLKDKGFYYHKNHGNSNTVVGVPDLECCIDGFYVGIEVKKDGGRQSTAQKFLQAKIEKNKGVYILAYSINDVVDVLRERGIING